MQSSAQHVTCGAMAAMTQSKTAGNALAEYERHLAGCEQCARHFADVSSYFNTSPAELSERVSQFVNTPDCSGAGDNLEKVATVIVSLLKADLSEESSLKLYAHLNDCYYCFEMFVRNWTDYLTTCEKIKGES